MKLIRFLSVIVAVTATIVLIGWKIDNPLLKSFGHGFIDMRPSIAILFLLSSALLIFQTMKPSIYSAFFITMFSMFLVMGTFWSMVFILNYKGGDVGNVQSVMPSPISLFTFLLVATSGFVAVLNTNEMFKRLRIIGILILSIGLMGIFGYTINEKFFYFYFDFLANGMALNTAILFAVVGAIIQMTSVQLQKRKNEIVE